MSRPVWPMAAAAEDCLTFGGSPAVRAAVEGALQCLVSFSFRLRGAVRSGAGRRAEEAWTQVRSYWVARGGALCSNGLMWRGCMAPDCGRCSRSHWLHLA